MVYQFSEFHVNLPINFWVILLIDRLTRSTGTVHTSTKVVRLTIAAIWWSGVSIWMNVRYGVNHFPYLPTVTNPENNPYPNGDPDRHQNLITCLLVHCQPSLKISCKSVRKFFGKVANRQTDRQTDNDDYISSSAEVTTDERMKTALLLKVEATRSSAVAV